MTSFAHHPGGQLQFGPSQSESRQQRQLQNPNEPSPIAASLLNHTSHPYSFTFTPFLQKTYQHSLPANRPICKAFNSPSGCPLKSNCPERHVTNAPQQQQQQPGGGGHQHQQSSFGSLVCKHWLRGLCKKGESCEFLHEYNLRKMPECNFFVRNGYCSNGDECLYLHIDPSSRLPPCPHYDRGFCPLGPRCDKKHTKRKICLYYLCGFCPDGKLCRLGAHPRWTWDKDMEAPQVRQEKTEEEKQKEEEEREARQREREMERRERDNDRHDGGDGRGGGGHKRGGGRYDGGRGGRWRGKGRGFRGRGGGH
ncbi:hypothetical protein QBC42DRAFT_223579 [Cladorrhinum samala]|uniref:mRNA 3'-end-processing protein n=1 Tax=Cladorrhinum samala TaxID=585594 RepID=A0AAV9HQR0_9PEZI|nr:hypothetical protein QBC42DRAFT_223579 [Cladorrhinum samala]